MAPLNGYTTTPHHRQNRRRERPGSRTRRTITRKANIQYDCCEGLLDASDIDVSLPSDKARPSPLFRQNFDQSWQRWKTRQAEEKALAEMNMLQLEEEQRRLFGDEVGDDELYRMGILYNEDDEDVTRDADANTISCDVPPLEHSFPMFVLRYGKPRRSRRRSTWRSLPPLYLSFSGLSDDADIACLLSRSIASTPIIQPCESPTPALISISIPISPTSDIDIPQSLPPPSAFESMYGSGSSLGCNSLSSSSHNTPLAHPISNQEDWTFINIPHTTHKNTNPSTPDPSTPSSEPETWILIDDS